jgi:LuxR family maltose regulon positive regulatory protein
LSIVAGTTGEAPRGTADMHVGRGQVALERGELDTARDHLAAARRLGEERGLPQFAYRSRTVAAMLAEAEGDLAGALALVLDAQQVYLGDFSPNVRPLHAVAARLAIRLGDLDAVERWARDHDVTAAQPLSYMREFEHVTLAEAMLARCRRDSDRAALGDVDRLLQRLLDAAAAGGRDAAVIEILVLRALTDHAADDTVRALMHLDRAVRLAEPEGQVRAFARHGALVVPMLEALAVGADASPYARALAPACRVPVAAAPDRGAAEPQGSADRGGDPLVDALSARELEVLHLLATDLDGPDIARNLFVSLNTLRTHTKNIYSKLGVNNRRAAVRRGRELRLLTGCLPRPRGTRRPRRRPRTGRGVGG